MIKFPCKCGFEFDVPEEMAGQPLQCPRCMLLNEVPLLSDLNELEGDGTIRLVSAPDPAREVRAAARACLAWAQEGVPFWEMAIAYRHGEAYLGPQGRHFSGPRGGTRCQLR